MKSAIRVLALWLMLVALPFQGFASASKLLCGSARPAAHMAQGAHHDHAAMQAAAQHDGAGNCHGGAMGDCCVAAALAHASPQAAARPQLAERVRVRDPVAPLPVDLALPKRPPRTYLA